VIIYKRLLSVLNLEQILMMAVLIERVQVRAIEQDCEQSLTIFFNRHGHPRRLQGTDTVILDECGVRRVGAAVKTDG